MPGAQKTTKSRTAAAKPVAKAKTTRTTTKAKVATDPRPPRRLKPPRYTSLRLAKRIKHPVVLPSSWKLAKLTRQLLLKNWRVIGGIVLVYTVLTVVLVNGLSGGLDIGQLKHEFDGLFTGSFGHLEGSLGIFALLVGASASASSSNGTTVYQSLLILMVSLALIWAYRQIMAGNELRVRDAYYKGMYPLVPVILVLLVMSLQLIPIAAGTWVFAIVMRTGIAVTTLEHFLWGALLFMLVLLSLYMVCSSIFALYIATLQDMTPMKALRSARQLVRHRRWLVLRKILFLPVWLIVAGTIIMLPIIWFVPVIAQWVFYVLLALGLGFGHGYMYILYRELLREK